jgi:hypothetical protein
MKNTLGFSLWMLTAVVSYPSPGMTQSGFDGLIADHEIHAPAKVARPGLHASYVDSVFKTTVTRITDPSQIGGNVSRVRHYYSKMNPFNADESRAILFSSDGGVWLYDARTWNPIRNLRIISGDPEIQWHPSDPYIFYFLDFMENSPNVRAMFTYDTRNDKKTLLRDFKEYDTARGKLEGNMDMGGRYYALIGKKGKNMEAFVYDVLNNKVSNRISVTERMADDWISVSPSGKYAVIMGGDRSRVYDINMNHLRDLPLGSFGHADLCLKADGSDAMVFDGADLQLDHNRNINIVDLATGKISVLTRIGWGTTPHISCRNLNFPGWALISTQGPDQKYPNHDFEIFWVKMDGSGQVRRVAHHHSSRENGGYFAEQHAVSNRGGSKIIFSSNWDNGTISDFLVELKAGRAKPSP